MPEGMATRGLRNPGGPDGLFDGVLQVLLSGVVPACLAAARIDGEIVGREDILPRPFAGCVPVFPVQGAGEINRSAAVGKVLLMEFLNPREMGLKRTAEPLREDGNAFPHALAFSNGNLTIPKIDILHAEPETLEQTQTAPVEEVCHDPVVSLQLGENSASFGAGKNDGKLRWAPDALDVDEFELLIQYLLVKKKQGAQSLVLR
jgi:hypothetical protein